MRISDWSSDVCSSDLRAAYRSAMRPPLAAIKDRVPLALRTSIDLPNILRADPIDPGILEPGRHGRGTVPDRFKRRNVIAAPHLFGQAPDTVHHRGNHHRHGYVKLDDPPNSH